MLNLNFKNLISHKDHYTYDYDDQSYIVKIGKSSPPQSFKTEAINTAKQIYQNAGNQPIMISLSGGIDSEFICNSFLEAKIPFSVIHAKFKNNLNEYDTRYVKKFCNKHDIKNYIFEIDIEQFFENKMFEYADLTTCSSPQFPVHMHLWDSFDGFIVAGHGDPIFLRDVNTSDFYFQIQEKEDSVFRYFVEKNRQGCPGFYVYRPEMLLSYLLEPEIMKLFLFGKNAKLLNQKGQKERIYHKCFDLEKRLEATGFELMNDLDQKYRNMLSKKYANRQYKVSIGKLIDMLWPENFINHTGAKYIPC